MSGLAYKGLAEQAELAASGQVSAKELVEASLARIDEVDGRVGPETWTALWTATIT